MIAGQPEWEIEIAFYVEYFGMPPVEARAFTIQRWMHAGDLRPLAAAIEEGPLDVVVLEKLRRMINDGRLKVVPGSPRKPERHARDMLAFLTYEASEVPSDEAFEEISKGLGIGNKSVRKAVSDWRKTRTRWGSEWRKPRG
jgi:hypothetical protein